MRWLLTLALLVATPAWAQTAYPPEPSGGGGGTPYDGGSVTNPFLAPSGCDPTPGYSFTDATTIGLCRDSGTTLVHRAFQHHFWGLNGTRDGIRISVGPNSLIEPIGTTTDQNLQINAAGSAGSLLFAASAGIRFLNPTRAENGSLANPAYSFRLAPDTGLLYNFDGTRDELIWSIDGQQSMKFEGISGSTYLYRFYNPNATVDPEGVEIWGSSGGNILYVLDFDFAGSSRGFGVTSTATENAGFIGNPSGTKDAFFRLWYTDSGSKIPFIEWTADTTFPYTTEILKLVGPTAAALAAGPFTATLPAVTGVVEVQQSSEPTCDATTRGQIAFVQGGATVADTYRVCAKNSSDTYAWYALATIP